MYKLIDFAIDINRELPFKTDLSSYWSKNFSPSEILTDHSILDFKNIGAEVREIQIFNSPSNFKSSIHMDGNGVFSDAYKNGGMGALNLVLGNWWSMQWFNLCENFKPELKFSPQTNNAYIPLNDNDVNLTSELHTTNRPFLLRVDYPHRIINYSDLNRLCISIRFKNNKYSRLKEIFE